jgi:clan AA aspartic protease
VELRGRFEHGMPFVSLRIAGEEFVALVDTDFDGYVMLSQADINRLNLREMGKTTYRTADGEIHEGRVYHGRIEWMGNMTDVAIDATNGDFALVGMGLLRSLRLVMEPARQLLTLSTDPLH